MCFINWVICTKVNDLVNTLILDNLQEIVAFFSLKVYKRYDQGVKKVVSDSLGLVDFAIGLVNSVINLPDGQVKFFEEFNLQKNCEINLLSKTFLGLIEMMLASACPNGKLLK